MRSELKILDTHSAFTIKPMDFKLHVVTLDKILHDCKVSDFSISGYVFKEWGQRSNYLIAVAPLLSKIYLKICCMMEVNGLHHRKIFDFQSFVPEMKAKFFIFFRPKHFKRYFSVISVPVESKIHKLVLNGRLHNGMILVSSVSGNAAKNRDRNRKLRFVYI